MAKRAQFMKKMHVRLITVRNRWEVLLFVFVASYFLCCGDVEVNPGPVNDDFPSQQKHDGEESRTTGRGDTDADNGKISVCSPSSSRTEPVFSHDVAAQILESIRQQEENYKSLTKDVSCMRSDVSSIRTDLGQVKAMCEDIGKRCDRLEEENERLSSGLKETNEDVSEIFSACKQNENTLSTVFSLVETMNTKIDILEEHCDILESFSRRDNLRFYGIPQKEQFESYDMCATLTADILNSVEAPKKWTANDFSRAHRIGESRNGQPKPMIVKFNRWKDKMTVLRDQNFRARLREKGVRVANDLTRKQADAVAEARKEGKVAFFRGGRLTVVPKQPDPRTYAEVAATAVDVSSSREMPVNSLVCSATGSRGCKVSGDSLGDDQREDGDPRHHSTNNRQWNNDDPNHRGGRGSVTAESRDCDPGSSSMTGSDSPHLLSKDSQHRGSREVCSSHKSASMERTMGEGRSHDTDECCAGAREFPHQVNDGRQLCGARCARGARGGVRVGRGGGSGQGQSRVKVNQSRDSQSVPARRISGHDYSSRLRRSARNAP